ncbi:hypothetical protein MPF_2104 [Methanohalophilus portucalensis FDF-1]|uniref:Uncharacterized protein n=1 Tax=Methanohalophilus portucalensis FDF-1 TaxID=523843 RepID=A0A1L9C1I5_9EURY|nr:hypothetical protein MPF_2104 [Methanohalophilus portucalensis FDF-1]
MELLNSQKTVTGTTIVFMSRLIPLMTLTLMLPSLILQAIPMQPMIRQ